MLPDFPPGGPLPASASFPPAGAEPSVAHVGSDPLWLEDGSVEETKPEHEMGWWRKAKNPEFEFHFHVYAWSGAVGWKGPGRIATITSRARRRVVQTQTRSRDGNRPT